MPGIIDDRDKLRAQIDASERTAEKEKDATSRKVEELKTEQATMQENMQEKVCSVTVVV